MEAIRRESVHNERIGQFQESGDVEQALIRQIVASINNQYVKELWDEETNTITKSILQIPNHLFSNLAEVTFKIVSKEEERIKTFHWVMIESPMLFYNMIEDLQTSFGGGKIPRTEQDVDIIQIGHCTVDW